MSWPKHSSERKDSKVPSIGACEIPELLHKEAHLWHKEAHLSPTCPGSPYSCGSQQLRIAHNNSHRTSQKPSPSSQIGLPTSQSLSPLLCTKSITYITTTHTYVTISLTFRCVCVCFFGFFVPSPKLCFSFKSALLSFFIKIPRKPKRQNRKVSFLVLQTLTYCDMVAQTFLADCHD